MFRKKTKKTNKSSIAPQSYDPEAPIKNLPAKRRTSITKEQRPSFLKSLQNSYSKTKQKVKNLPKEIYTFETDDDDSEPEVTDYLKRRRSSILGLERRGSFNDDMAEKNRRRRLENCREIYQSAVNGEEVNEINSEENDINLPNKPSIIIRRGSITLPNSPFASDDEEDDDDFFDESNLDGKYPL